MVRAMWILYFVGGVNIFVTSRLMLLMMDLSVVFGKILAFL